MLSNALRIAASDGVRFASVQSGRQTTVTADALVLVTARLPNADLATELEDADGGPRVRVIGDALAPGTIAHAVWDGHRYAEELEDPAAEDRDHAPFRRELIALARPHAAIRDTRDSACVVPE